MYRTNTNSVKKSGHFVSLSEVKNFEKKKKRYKIEQITSAALPDTGIPHESSDGVRFPPKREVTPRH
jgi:hypothetical protein